MMVSKMGRDDFIGPWRSYKHIAAVREMELGAQHCVTKGEVGFVLGGLIDQRLVIRLEGVERGLNNGPRAA
jgi:hypothetical protein